MHAFLFVGRSGEKREQAIQEKLREWGIGTFDSVTLSGSGISDVRQFQNRLLLKPFQSPFTVGIVRNGEALTLPAQQALLKTLEEPPPHARIILETGMADSLLPTIVSRCFVIRTTSAASEYTKEDVLTCSQTIKKLTHTSPGQKMTIIDGITTTKEETTNWIDLAIAASREDMLRGNYEAAKLVKKLLRAHEQLSVNVNPKLVLDNVFLSF